MRSFTLLFTAFTLSLACMAIPANSQELSDTGSDWRQFELPGLSNTEVEIIRTMLRSDNYQYLGQVLTILRQGVSRGTVSPQSPEYALVVAEITAGTRVRIANPIPGTGYAKPNAIQELWLAELISWLPAEQGQAQFDAFLDVSEEIAVLQAMVKAHSTWQVPYSPSALKALRSALSRMTIGLVPVDASLIAEICAAAEITFTSAGLRPAPELLEGLLELLERSSNGQVRHRIQGLFKLLYGF